jgi:oligoendopeptidase F
MWDSAIEIPSIFGELILVDYLLDSCSFTDEQRATVLLNQVGNSFIHNLHRQVQNSLFTEELHRQLRTNKNLSIERVDELFIGFMRELMGEEVDLEVIRQEHSWVFNHNLYSTHFLKEYIYATGILIAVNLFLRWKSGEEGITEKLKEFYVNGISVPLPEQLRKLNITVDWNFVSDAIGFIESRLSLAEKTLKNKGVFD